MKSFRVYGNGTGRKKWWKFRENIFYLLVQMCGKQKKNELNGNEGDRKMHSACAHTTTLETTLFRAPFIHS